MRSARRRRRCSTASDETQRPFVEALEPRLMLSAIYVDAIDHNGAAPNDGKSWYSAYTDLQAALKAAASGTDIFVAGGTYKPTAGTDRTISFVLKNGVRLYGGYSGYGAPDPDTRDVAAYPTILSGDIGTIGTNADNTYHVVVGSGTDATAVLDGFTVTAGTANGTSSPWTNGGGMYNDHGSPTIRYCTFSGNSATSTYGSGGGMFNSYSSPILTDCTFSGNSAAYGGGGMFNDSSSPSLINCTFSDNSATSASGYGGGMYNSSSSSPTLTNCTFSANSTKGTYGWGGGMYNNSSSPSLTNCTFSSNTATFGGGMYNNNFSYPRLADCTFSGNSTTSTSGYGGGMYNNYYSSPNLTNCTFSSNTATFGGGMNNNNYSSPSLTNCILWANAAQFGPQMYDLGSSGATVRYSDIQGGWTGTGNINADPLFVDADGPDNIYGTPDDDLRLRATSPCIDAGDNSAVAADTLDLDSDGNTTEPVPFDLGGQPRFVDAPWVADTGKGTSPIVDMGAYERQLRVPGDADDSGLVDQDDYKIWYDNYGTGTTWEQGNFKGSGVTDQDDYKTWYDNYGVGTAGGSAAVTSQPTAGLDAATPSPMLAGISQFSTTSRLSATTTSSSASAEVAGNTTQTNAKVPALLSVTAPTSAQHNRKLAARRAARLAATTAGCNASAPLLFAEACVVHLDGL